MGAWGSFLVRLFLLFISLLSKTIGFAVICIACVLITTVVFTHSHVVLPALFRPDTWGFYASFAMTVWVSTGVWLNYLGSLGCTPGTVPSGFIIKRENKPNSGKICYFCNCSKSERVHHCSFCGHCVQKMDHHCPWINNCVGYRNQRYFNGFLLYLLMGTLFCMSFPLYMSYHSERFPRQVLSNNALTLNLVICVALFVAMLGFVSWNMYLAVSNQTAIETHINMDARARAKASGVLFRNPFDLGRWRNFLAVFLTRGEKDQWFRFYAKAFWESRGRAFDGVTFENYNSQGSGGGVALPQTTASATTSRPLLSPSPVSTFANANTTTGFTSIGVSNIESTDEVVRARGAHVTSPLDTTTTNKGSTTLMSTMVVTEEGGIATQHAHHHSLSPPPLSYPDRVAESLRILIHEKLLASGPIQWIVNPTAKLLEICGTRATRMESSTVEFTEMPHVLNVWFYRRLASQTVSSPSQTLHLPPSVKYSPSTLFEDGVAVMAAVCTAARLNRLTRLVWYLSGISSSKAALLLLPSIPVARANQSLLETLAFLVCCAACVLFWRAGDLLLHLALCALVLWPNVQETVDEGLVYPRWTDEV